MARDPIVSLASVLAAQPGAYALLIGSGVSRSAGIPTGWEVSLDLIRRFAVGRGDAEPEDPVEWYKEQFAADVDYSALLEDLAPARGDRRALLDRYFEASDDDLEQGLKAPTDAHRAIALLVEQGVVNVIITTNFDRLLETALQEAGIEPTIIASASDAGSAAPLHTSRVVVIKIHGDRNSPNLKNTLGELDAYEEELEDLIANVFSQYGLLICGWSADWDPALRRLAEAHETSVFSTYFTYRSSVGNAASQLLKKRQAIPIPIASADSFFVDLATKVEAIQSMSTTSEVVDTAELKLLLPESQHRIRLRDLVQRRIGIALDLTTPDRFSTEAVGERSLEEYEERIQELLDAASPTAEFFATLAFYADESRHDDLWVNAMERIARAQRQQSGATELLDLQRLPATLVLYVGGVASILARRITPAARALADITVIDPNRGTEVTIAYDLAPARSISDALAKQFPDYVRHHTPASDILRDTVVPILRHLESDESRIDDAFDDLEYLMGLTSHDKADREWAGRFIWRRDRYVETDNRSSVLRSFSSQLLDAGMFEGEEHTMSDAKDAYEAAIASWRSRMN